jgi:hypothetical protein
VVRHTSFVERAERLKGWILAAAVALGGCTGNIGEPPAGQSPSAVCKGIQPGDAPIRRMTRFEYNNTVRDLLGDTTSPANGFAPEEEALGFNNQAAALTVTQLLAEQYMSASEKIAERAAQDLGALLPCDPQAIGEDACARQFVDTFGKRAFRRPLDPAQASRLFSLYQWGRGAYDFSTGIQLVIQAALQSPAFLYRVEFGMPDPVAKGVVELDSYELASRLSYLLWASMPDDELFAAAEGGKLRTAADVEAQAKRMLDDPRARTAVRDFHAQWLGLGVLDTLTRDPSIYPDFDPAIRAHWKEETLEFLGEVIFEDPDGDVHALFTAPYSMLNGPLASFYGVEGPTGDAFERVDLDPDQRAGFLTHAGVMATYAKPNQSSPIHRGKFVRERLLCQLLKPPPADLVIVPPEVDPKATTREKFAEHSQNPGCAVCHRLMDPIGFGFEHYDALGRWRDEDHGLPVDATGEVLATRDSNGAFDGAIELAKRLGSSEEVRQCVATQWFRYGYGRAEGEADQCAMEQLQGAFEASHYNIKALLVALTQTDAFRYRKAVVPGP